jgi:rare lipoprotein A
MKLSLVALITLLLVSACSTTNSRYQHADDFTPEAIANVEAIPDPVPESEPRSALGNPASYKVLGKRYELMSDATGFKQEGIASWYGMKFHGHRTSNGEIFDVYQLTAAHKTLPLPAYVKVTRTDTQESVVVRVNDRGPFHEGRIIDLSYAAAVKLGIHKLGTAPVSIEVLKAPLSQTVRWVQVGALSTPEAADKLKKRLTDITTEQWDIGVYPTASKEKPLHRVRIGPVPENKLDALLNELKQNGVNTPVVLARYQL